MAMYTDVIFKLGRLQEETLEMSRFVSIDFKYLKILKT